MVFVVSIETSTVGCKPPAAVGERVSKNGGHDLGAAAPFSTKTLSLQGRAEGSPFTPKQVEDFGLS